MIGKSILHHLKKSKIDYALIYKETKIDSTPSKIRKEEGNCCTRPCNKETENLLMPTLFNIRIDGRVAM